MGGSILEKGNFNYSELLGQQIAQFDQLKLDIKRGQIKMGSLSLGIDRKNGHTKKISQEIHPDELGKMTNDAKATLDRNSVLDALCVGGQSGIDFETAKLQPDKYPWLIKGKNFQPRLFLQHTALKDGSQIINQKLYDTFARLFGIIRSVGYPVKFKEAGSNYLASYGRGFRDVVEQSLIIFSEEDAWDLADKLGTFAPDALAGERRIPGDLEIIDRAFFVATFPGDPHFDISSNPIDPSMSVRDRVSREVDKQSDQNGLMEYGDDYNALWFGRLGATATAIYKVEDNKVIVSAGSTTYDDNAQLVDAYLINALSGRMYKRTNSESNNLNSLHAETRKKLPTTKLTLFHGKHEGVGGLVDVTIGKDRFVFYLKAKSNSKRVVDAGQRLIG